MPIQRGWIKSPSHIGSVLVVLRVLDPEGTCLKNRLRVLMAINTHEYEKGADLIPLLLFLRTKQLP
jgi:hypothetical protein